MTHHQVVLAARLPPVDRRRPGVGALFFSRGRETHPHTPGTSRAAGRIQVRGQYPVQLIEDSGSLPPVPSSPVDLSEPQPQFQPRELPDDAAAEGTVRMLCSLRTSDGLELVRSAAERLLPELLEAEATSLGHHGGVRAEGVHLLGRRPGQGPPGRTPGSPGARFPASVPTSTRRSSVTVPRTTPAFPAATSTPPTSRPAVNLQIASQTVAIAIAAEDGGREVLGVMVGDSEAFWSHFLRSLREHGLPGLRLVISDHQSGLVKAIRKVMIGAFYQRCRFHFVRNVFGVIRKGSRDGEVPRTADRGELTSRSFCPPHGRPVWPNFLSG